MADLASIRAQYPEYDDLSDAQLAQGLHTKFYSDMPLEDFAARIGMPTVAASGGQSPLAQSLIGQDATNLQKLGRGIAGGLSQIVPFGAQITAGGASLVDAIKAISEGQPLEASTYEQRLAEIQDYQGAFNEAIAPSTTASVFEKVGPALLLPGQGALRAAVKNPVARVGASAVEGAGWGGVYGASGAEEGQMLEGAMEGASLGGLFGAGAGAIGEGLSALGSGLDKSGKALGRKAFGARQSDYAKSANRLGIITDVPDDEIGTYTKAVLDDFAESNALGLSREPAKLVQRASQQEQALEKQIGAIVRSYDDLVGSPVKPDFTNAYEMITSGRIPADKVPSYLKRLEALESGIEENGKGTLSYLQQQKVAIGKDWVPEDSVRNEFTRAIYSDLQRTIANHVPDVAPINQQLRKYKVLMPILQRGLAAEESATGLNKFIQSIRTSGGGGVPLLAGMYTGHPLLGAATTAAMAAAGNPTGMGITGRALQGLGSRAAGVGDVATRAIAPLAVAGSEFSSEKPQAPSLPRSQRTPTGQSELRASSSYPNSVFDKDQSLSEPSVFAKVLDAVKLVESSGDPNAIGPETKYGRAKGAYQFLDSTGKEYHKKLGIKEPYDPHNESQQRKLAAAYITDLLEMFDGDMALALTAFHTGPENVRKGKIGPVGRNYARSVFEKI